MKKNVIELKPRFVLDEQGNRVEVILDIQTYDQLVDHFEDHYLGKMAEEVLASESKEDFMDLQAFRKALSQDSGDDE